MVLRIEIFLWSCLTNRHQLYYITNEQIGIHNDLLWGDFQDFLRNKQKKKAHCHLTSYAFFHSVHSGRRWMASLHASLHSLITYWPSVLIYPAVLLSFYNAHVHTLKNKAWNYNRLRKIGPPEPNYLAGNTLFFFPLLQHNLARFFILYIFWFLGNFVH